jgi:hypothetical protein
MLEEGSYTVIHIPDSLLANTHGIRLFMQVLLFLLGAMLTWLFSERLLSRCYFGAVKTNNLD